MQCRPSSSWSVAPVGAAWHTFCCLDTLPCRWSEPPQFPTIFSQHICHVEISTGLIPKSHNIHHFKINLVDLTTWATSNYLQGYPYWEREQVKSCFSGVEIATKKGLRNEAATRTTTRQMSFSCSFNWLSIQLYVGPTCAVEIM